MDRLSDQSDDDRNQLRAGFPGCRLHSRVHELFYGHCYVSHQQNASFCMIAPDRRHTLYKHRTMAMHVRNFWWFEANVCEHDEGVQTNQDCIRAWASSWFAECYVPPDLVDEWKVSNWEMWINDPPPFFTEEFKSGHRILGEAVTQIAPSRVATVNRETQVEWRGLPSQATVLAEWRTTLMHSRKIYRKTSRVNAKLAHEHGVVETVVDGHCGARKSYKKGCFIIIGSRGGRWRWTRSAFQQDTTLRSLNRRPRLTLLTRAFNHFLPSEKYGCIIYQSRTFRDTFRWVNSSENGVKL